MPLFAILLFGLPSAANEPTSMLTNEMSLDPRSVSTVPGTRSH